MNPLITSAYRQLWDDPALQSRIDDGIRRHRQSDAELRVTDYAGQPLPGVRLKLVQHDSPFQFGANSFMLGGYDDALNRRYEDAFCALFNGATVPFYWRTLEPVRGHPRYEAHSVPIPRRPPPEAVLDFCRERGLRPHGHTLVWNLRKWSVPDWLPENPAEAEALWERRVRELGERYGARIKRWDVLNEAVAYYERTEAGLPMTSDYEAKAFRWAAQYFPPDTRLDINETTAAWNLAESDYGRLIERLLAAKLPVGAIGLQFHLFNDADILSVLKGERFRPDDLLAALDHYGQFALPVHISEITLSAPGNTPEGQEAQALVARNFYRLWFSHPATEGITWWNLPDGGAAPGEGRVYSGLVHADMSPKPAYTALRQLLRREWRTEVEGVTDADGRFRFRGFHGTYQVQTDSGQNDSGIVPAVALAPGKTTQEHIRL